MPLPDSGTPWPPTDPCVQNALADWDAWYSADPDQLEQRYLNRGSQGLPENRPTQYRGGLVGRMARWFWGNPVPDGQKREKLHIPLAGDIARTSSDLLFSEPPKLVVDHPTTQTRLDELVDGGLHPTLLEAGEVCAALGGSYLRVVWDDQVADRPWVSTVGADAAAPEFAYGKLRAVTFWTVVRVDGREVWRHLERHERGFILNGLYKGGPSDLGKAMPLAAHPDTRGLRDVMDTKAPKNLTASYVPNVRPARAWRNIPAAAYWGQSDYQGIEGIMDALDETYSSWMRDVQNGKGRIIVADSLLRSNGPGQGASWDEDRRIYSGLNMLPRAGDPNPITSVQFEIRVAEHRDTCQELVEQAVRQAGYSASTFGETGDGAAITATEIRARERRSMATRARKALYWGPGIADIVAAQLAVEQGLFGVSGLDLEPPKVEFQDSISDGPAEIAATAALLRQAEAASTETLVRMLNPDWDKDQVKTEVTAILGESGRAVADPTLTGAEGGGHAGFPSDGGGPGPGSP
jgi:A118 family predicted phage portal protein